MPTIPLREYLSSMLFVIPVEMGEMRISSRRTDQFLAVGLGACIGACLYDPISTVAGMVHVVLPCAPSAPQLLPKRPSPPLPGKFADTAITRVIDEMEQAGAVRSRLR